MKADRLRIHHFEPVSSANGPGKRAVLWVQGCGLHCPGCFNPQTHATRGGEWVNVEEMAARILAARSGLEGITLSGGEPLSQRAAITHLVQAVRAQSNLSVVLFSGYAWQEIQAMPDINQLLTHVDVLLAGRYQAEARVADGLIGSANKTVHFLSSRYTASDLEQVPQAEVILSPDGEILFSGIHPLQW